MPGQSAMGTSRHHGLKKIRKWSNDGQFKDDLGVPKWTIILEDWFVAKFKDDLVKS